MTITREQEAFLEECSLEFSDRFTDADLEYRKIYDLGIPKPPIMHPWFGRSRYGNRDYRDRGESRNNRSADNYREHNWHSRERRHRPY